MSVHRFIVIIFLVVTVGILLTWQHSEVVRSGYRLNLVNREKRLLREKLKARASSVESIRSPSFIANQILKMGLNLSSAPLEPVLLVERDRL